MICRGAESLTDISKSDRRPWTVDGKTAILSVVSVDGRRSTVDGDRSTVIGRPSSYNRSIVSPGSTVTERKLDIRTRPGAAPFGLLRNLRCV